ncbi:type VI secretion system baseplate subunit TssG [Massilia endophytica]|uniref:type VI secretion system baseplate subunit TssG n=1 Tax=Massilia endophytica TaxID=2899220 RepID=UPI001E53DC72|nr:type VI secretion system baseplate subunit TssG [Massilia endophytica]UGQ48421.1 type VI secretion system baseplate subunit TssG [Massilia endophytica]
MPAAQRQAAADLITLFQLLRRQGGEAAFGNDPSLAFAVRDLASVKNDPLHVVPAFIGLLGASGVLPFHYTDRLLRHAAQTQDLAPLAFLDVLSSRSVALYAEAWRRRRPEFDRESGTDAFLGALLALAGERGADTPERAAFHAGALRRATVSAEALGAALEDHFGVPVELAQFAGGWQMLAERDRVSLGCANSALGSMALGQRIWNRSGKFGLRLGPLGAEDFERFLPGSSGAAALADMVGEFALGPLRCEVRLLLSPDAVCSPRLGGEGVRLGFDTFLVSPAAAEVREDAVYSLSKNSMI